jgi:hypothetical protein
VTTPYGTTSVWITTSELGGGPAVGQRSQRRSLPHCVERSERNKEQMNLRRARASTAQQARNSSMSCDDQIASHFNMALTAQVKTAMYMPQL